MASFSERLAAAVTTTNTPLCVGIDPFPDRLPGADPADSRADRARRALRFGRAILAACRGHVPAVKPQFAFFEQMGPEGMGVLATLLREAREAGLLVVGDAKRGDIGTTATAYAAATLGPDAPFPCDALTVSPFLGGDTLEPFVAAAREHAAGLFVLFRTSNPGSAQFQEPVADALAAWLTHAGRALTGPDGLSPIGVVIGATRREALSTWRGRLPHAWFLVPGYGAQGATAADCAAAFRPDGLGALIPSSRSLTFPDAPDAAWVADPGAFVSERIRQVRAELDGVVRCVAPP